MKRVRWMFVLAMLVAGFLVLGVTDSVAAQDTSLCDAANMIGPGAEVDGYTVVYGMGGSGNQIVLGYGGECLSGGSGNDVFGAQGGMRLLPCRMLA